MEKVTLKINGMPVVVEKGATILDAAKKAGIKIPTLCFLKDCNETGACRVCTVEVKGARSLAAACVYPVSEGMEVFTHSNRAVEARKNTVELILSNHSKNCLSCVRNQTCELQQLSQDLGIRDVRYSGEVTPPTFDDVAPGIVRDTSKCVLCGRCVSTCTKVQGLGVLGFQNRGFQTKVGPVFDKSFADVNCMQCGQCVNVCPVGALVEKENIHDVIQALNDPNKHVIVQTAPAVRASLGEEFGMPIGTRVTGKMVSALKKMGFNRVYDTNYAADLTIMEEGTEFIERVKENGTLPMITSCSPGWIRYIEFEYPDLLSHLSSCKSPHMMFGAVLKSYYAEAKGIDPRDIYVVSVMPCTAKKAEIERPEMKKDGIKDVDTVITTRELGRMIKMYGIDFTELPDSEFDQDMFGEYSGAGVIFGATGGVMEAALRTVAEVLEGKSFENVDYEAVRGMAGVKTAALNIAGMEVRVAVASSMSMAKPLLDEIRNGTSPYHFIEIMGCPGGCINGGGQSIISASIRNGFKAIDWKKERAKALYEEDELMPVRKSHENEQIQQLYKNYFEKPGSHKAHELLHTTYSKKERFK
ncbi:MAG: 2Fe-2S iron-sulfur cluster binding domain-containing protein [Erysipelotrichaceae bacterium]|nr:2Fe-2S iron-sulfur cluster binding domain-containing protein [Erysipelotrichaceae bacterium]MBQ4342327.1 iron hydrogenase small subunit [Erysipelotrichaceae bacterium]